ncbi:MAG: sugar phosphate nucleotidyltransferase [Thermoleophilia bacterium]
MGGEGRRLRPLTDTRPKPMMQLVDRPFVAHQLDLLRRHGVDDIVFSCGYRPDALRAHFGDGTAMGVRLRYVVDPEPLGTAGAIKNAEDLLGDAPFLVLNGDILTDLDLAAFAARHAETGASGTIALTPVEDPSAFGLVRLFDDGRVEAFVEKPRPDELRPGEPYRINAGTYLLAREVLDRIPAGQACSIEREVFPALAEDGLLHGYPSDAYWRDIGTHRSYLEANHDVLTGAIETESPAGGAYLGPDASVDGSATVDARSAVGAGARVGPGAVVTASVIGAGTAVGAGAVVDGAIVGEGVDVGDGARLGPGVVVGDGARIAAGEVVDPATPVPTGADLAA